MIIEFTGVLDKLVDSHADVIPILARGIHESRRYMSNSEITDFLNGMIQARIGIRVLAEHHLALHRSDFDSHRSGIVDHQLSPFKVLKRAAPYAQELCELHYGVCPDFVINGHLDTVFPYIDVHLEYILFELLKNAFRATAERSRRVSTPVIAPVEITIAKGKEDVTIRLRDEGGGIPDNRLQQVWDYSFTTVDEEENGDDAYEGQLFRSATKLGAITGTGYVCHTSESIY